MTEILRLLLIVTLVIAEVALWQWRVVLAGRDHRIGAVPHEALSMGMGTILQSRRIVLLVTGRSKARAVARVLSGRLTTRVPASFLQLHRDVEVWLDGDAAALISSS